MANITAQHKVWANIIVLSEALHDHHYITLSATIPIRKSGIYSALMLGGCTAEVHSPWQCIPHGSARFAAWLYDLKGFFQPK